MFFYSWWVIRVPVLLLPFSFHDMEIFFLLFGFLFIHFSLGLKTLLNDYLHNKKTKFYLLVLVRLANLEFLRYFLEFLI